MKSVLAWICFALIGGASASNLTLTNTASVKTRDGEVSTLRKLGMGSLEFTETVCTAKAGLQQACSSKTTKVDAAQAACLERRFAYEDSEERAKADLTAHPGGSADQVAASWLSSCKLAAKP